MNCPICGNELNENDQYCSQCGHKIEKVKYCKECGAELKENAKFCHVCGVATEEIKEEVKEVAEEKVKEEVQEDHTRTCKLCGTVLKDHENICPMCGSKYEEEITSEVIVPEIKQVELKCPFCGKVYKEGDQYCQYCGKSFFKKEIFNFNSDISKNLIYAGCFVNIIATLLPFTSKVSYSMYSIFDMATTVSVSLNDMGVGEGIVVMMVCLAALNYCAKEKRQYFVFFPLATLLLTVIVFAIGIISDVYLNIRIGAFVLLVGLALITAGIVKENRKV